MTQQTHLPLEYKTQTNRRREKVVRAAGANAVSRNKVIRLLIAADRFRGDLSPFMPRHSLHLLSLSFSSHILYGRTNFLCVGITLISQ
jgi:hypothetical protein